ncbi:Filament-like plant protein 7 [Vitis vinifera]|uniref:Filament-like plant protein 7 n=1 Tax=Vitis vinifera TaxID=29760 RepID=A0A438FMH5_VITVI|nr:Filament-like plant protein 7 [Vitis vinifera]
MLHISIQISVIVNVSLDHTDASNRDIRSRGIHENLNEKLAAVVDESKTKDDLVTKYARMAEEAIAGREKAEAEALSLKQELDEALNLGVAAKERLSHLDAALKQCMQQLTSLKEEQEQRIRDAVMKTLREFEKTQKNLEDNLTETSKRLTDLTVENTHLSKALLAKEKLIEDLCKIKSQADTEFKALMARLDSTEKENAFLKYEFRMLEKELEIRNEEREFNRRSAEAIHKQHLESVKKIAKLEAECQRLRLLVRKRLPGPAAVAKMKSEVETLGRDQTEMRRKKLNPMTGGLIARDGLVEKSSEIPSKKMSFLIERLCEVEEENKTLKEILTKKNNELHSPRLLCARTPSRFGQPEAQLGESPKSQKTMDLVSCSPISNGHSLPSGFDIGSDDGISSSGSWANALISELEQFRHAKPKNPSECKTIVSDMSLMDDFVEMEKLAIVSADTHFQGSHVPSNTRNASANTLEKESGGFLSDSTGKELVPVAQDYSSSTDKKWETQSKDGSIGKSRDWLQDVLKVMLEQNCVSKRSLRELLDDIKIALGFVNDPSVVEADKAASSRHLGEPDSQPISGYITWKSMEFPMAGSLHEGAVIDTSAEGASHQQNQSDLSKSICKIIELIKSFNLTSLTNSNAPNEGSEGDKSSSPSDLENFVGELAFTLHWIMSNCITLQDGSSMRDEIKRHFGWGASQSESEPEIQSNLQEENRGLKDELRKIESAKKDLEAKLQSATDNSQALMNQLEKSEQSIGSLRTELETLKDSKGLIEDQIENQKLINEELNTQLTVAKAKINEVLQKFSALEVEFEDKSNSCQELEATCLELQLQLESFPEKEVSEANQDQEGKQLQTGWEITAASVKLAECQETILNLGKQLKALASPRDRAIFDKVYSTTSTATNDKKLSHRSSLRDRMLADDDADTEVFKSPKIKEIISTAHIPSTLGSNNSNSFDAPDIHVEAPDAYHDSKHRAVTPAVGSLAIVPSKKKGGAGFLRKLLQRRRKGVSKRSLSYAKV